MKVSAFKKLIMEAAKEGVLQGLQEIFQEQQPKNIKENLSFTTNDVNPAIGDIRRNLAQKMGAIFENKGDDPYANKKLEIQHPTEANGNNAYMAFLMDTAENITPQDKAAFRNLD
jgi:hypothetical protein